MIGCRNLTVELGGKARVEDVTLEARPGELLALVGPNGAGKSTLLRALAGEIEPVSGGVWLGDEPLARWRPQQRARRLAVLPQAHTVAFPLSSEDVVLLGRTPYHRWRRSATDREIARAALRRVGGEHLAGRPYPVLSGGEQKRVQLARVLAQVWEAGDSATILLDEPTAALDLCHQHGVLAIAASLAARGAAVIAVLHDLNLAGRYAHRMALLCQGRLVGTCSGDEMFSADLLEQTFAIRPHFVTLPHQTRPWLVSEPALEE